MKTILIAYTEERFNKLVKMGYKFEEFEGSLAVSTNFNRDFFVELIDSLD